MSIINLLLGNEESKISIDLPSYEMKYKHSNNISDTSVSLIISIIFYINNTSILTIHTDIEMMCYLDGECLRLLSEKELKEGLNRIKKFSEALKTNRKTVLETYLISGYKLIVSNNLLKITTGFSTSEEEAPVFSETCTECKLSDDNRKELAESFLNLYEDCKSIVELNNKFIKLKDDL